MTLFFLQHVPAEPAGVVELVNPRRSIPAPAIGS